MTESFVGKLNEKKDVLGDHIVVICSDCCGPVRRGLVKNLSNLVTAGTIVGHHSYKSL